MHDQVIRIADSLIVPSTPAVTVAYAKKHIRALQGSSEDILIAMWIDAAAAYFEEQTGRQLTTATREAWLDAFPFGCDRRGRPQVIELPRPPLQTVVSVKYVNGDGALVDFEDGASPSGVGYGFNTPAGPYAACGKLWPLSGSAWPIAACEPGSVRIQYTCGYGDGPDDIPALATQILCYLVGHFDTFRSAVHEARRGQVLELPYGVQMMMDGFKYSALTTTVLRTNARWPL